jgi:hypothetical protein
VLVHAKEMVHGKWRKVGDDMSCHINIHVSCQINQSVMLYSMCHATSTSTCHSTSTNKWSMANNQVGWIGEVFSLVKRNGLWPMVGGQLN